jgi:predicted DNA-binding protein with PD1-like motif
MMESNPALAEFKSGRCLAGRLPHGRDLLKSIEKICEEYSITMATFTLIGAVSCATFGAYDQAQQVYVTVKEEKPLEIVSCTGNISLKEGHPFVHAHILLCDDQGKSLGGHLFSETLIYAGEIHLRELIGEPLNRAYDETTGLMLWNG